MDVSLVVQLHQVRGTPGCALFVDPWQVEAGERADAIRSLQSAIKGFPEDTRAWQVGWSHRHITW